MMNVFVLMNMLKEYFIINLHLHVQNEKAIASCDRHYQKGIYQASFEAHHCNFLRRPSLDCSIWNIWKCSVSEMCFSNRWFTGCTWQAGVWSSISDTCLSIPSKGLCLLPIKLFDNKTSVCRTEHFNGTALKKIQLDKISYISGDETF